MSVSAAPQRAPGELFFDGTWDGWRMAAREALQASRDPGTVFWRSAVDTQDSLFGAGSPSTFSSKQSKPAATVPRDFVTLGADVACHASLSRWDALYRVLWRLVHGERHLLEVFVDEDVHLLQQMAKVVRREGHKLRAFVRFRCVAEGTPAERYVAWFEPEHDVLAREAPFFARRFPSMRWSILTPALSAHWDGESLAYGAGVSRLDAPSGDDLEALWRTYYAHTFNPARVKPKLMRAEMPTRYWKHLPEAQLIAPLLRDAPARVREMVETQRQLALPSISSPRTGQLPAPGPARVRTAPVHDAGIAAAAERSRRARAHLVSRGVTSPSSPVEGCDVRVGTASWTDPTMTASGVFYPDGVRSAEARLGHYASQFSLVEVDATYYAMPAERVSRLWVERTPDGFLFDIKAHALMTGHSTSVARLPADIREALPHELRGAKEVSAGGMASELLDEIWRRFFSALTPLREAGKLGALLLQLPRHLDASEGGERLIAQLRERAGDACCAVELRHASWVTGAVRRERTLDLFRAHDLAFVMVDAPPGFSTSMPVMTAVTSDRLAVVRMHGRRRETWEKAVDAVSERYRYLYDSAELGEWVPRIIDVAQRTQGVHVVMNNCHANYGTSNADEINALLVEADLERRRMSRAGRLIVD